MTSQCNDAENCRRIALTVAYDGTNYAGFQLQAGTPTIQGELESAISRLTGAATRIRGASRTDAGAHACGQVVDFITDKPYGTDVFLRAVNHYLPDAIRAIRVDAVPHGFHARRSATRRVYQYTILNRTTPSPLLRNTHHRVPEPLNLPAMAQAARSLTGIRDFRRIATRHPAQRSAVRWVYEWQVLQNPANEDVIVIKCAANGFLRYQIRRVNAVLIEIGRGRQPIHAMAEALAGRSPVPRQIPTLPAHGLCLMSVHYPEYDHILKVTNHDETH